MIPPISPSLTAQSSGLSATSGTPSKDEFLKLLVTQMQHQDPLAPKDDTAYVAQLAQFAQLEQAQNQTAILQQMQTQGSSQSGAQAVSLMGHEVTANFDSVAVQGGGAPAPVQFTLDQDAASVTITIRDATGQVVRTLPGGALKTGPQAIAWDGKARDGSALPAGTYKISVDAQDKTGASVTARTQVTGVVSGVSFADGYPVLLVGGARARLGDIVAVNK